MPAMSSSTLHMDVEEGKYMRRMARIKAVACVYLVVTLILTSVGGRLAVETKTTASTSSSTWKAST